MRKQFSLFQSHLDLAHHYWSLLLKPGDTVIDATCGNGLDSLFLAKHCLESDKGQLICLDIQDTALTQTRHLLSTKLPNDILARICLIKQCHSTFPLNLILKPPKLVVYNLGYLPKGEKNLTTQTNTTLKSIHSAMDLLAPGGAISLTCYPGHPEGKKEEEAIQKFLTTLDSTTWSCCFHRWENRNLAPSLILIQRSFLTSVFNENSAV